MKIIEIPITIATLGKEMEAFVDFDVWLDEGRWDVGHIQCVIIDKVDYYHSPYCELAIKMCGGAEALRIEAERIVSTWDIEDACSLAKNKIETEMTHDKAI